MEGKAHCLPPARAAHLQKGCKASTFSLLKWEDLLPPISPSRNLEIRPSLGVTMERTQVVDQMGMI